MSAEESTKSGFYGGQRLEEPEAPEKLTVRAEGARRPVRQSTLQGDGLAPDLKRPDDAMVAQPIAELPRRDAQQGGGARLHAVGPGLMDLGVHFANSWGRLARQNQPLPGSIREPQPQPSASRRTPVLHAGLRSSP